MISHPNNTDTVRSIRSGPRYKSLPQREGRAELGPAAVPGLSLQVSENMRQCGSKTKRTGPAVLSLSLLPCLQKGRQGGGQVWSRSHALSEAEPWRII